MDVVTLAAAKAHANTLALGGAIPIPGPPGSPGQPGQNGQGVSTGGTTGQILEKASNDDFDTRWVNKPVGGTGGGLQAEIITVDRWLELEADPSLVEPDTLYITFNELPNMPELPEGYKFLIVKPGE